MTELPEPSGGEPTRSPFWPRGVPRTIRPLPPTVCEALRRSAARVPDRTAIAFYGREISYRDLLGQVERLAAYLQLGCGVRAGDRVLLDMQNSPHFIAGFQAILRAGAVVVPINPMNLGEELAYFASDSGARIALAGAEFAERFAPLVPSHLDRVVLAGYGDGLPAAETFRRPAVIAESVLPDPLPPGFVAWRTALAERRPPAPDRVAADDLCVMPYTSGTTDRPKACLHTHESAVFTALAQAEWYGFGEDAVLSAFMPLFHVAGMQFSMGAGLASGATLVLMARWDRSLVAPLFVGYGVTAWSASPTMILDVLAAEDFDEAAFRHLRTLTGGGAPMPAAVAERLRERFGLTFVEGYGLSETLSATHINPPDRAKPQCLGIPIHETRARVVDPATLDDLAVGEIGEIAIAGPQVMRGYWRRPDADREAFFEREGRRYLRTGDLGRMDEDGYFHLVDRLKRMISVSGYKVWPAECEAALYRHPAVQECCVVAAPDPYRGETVKAFVVRRPGATLAADELIAWARTVMAAYKAPRLVEFVESLPRSGSSKIDWRGLQDAEWTRGAAPPATGS